jgi:hypothetical protein
MLAFAHPTAGTLASMRGVTVSLFALAAIACEDKAPSTVAERPSESITIPTAEREVEPEAPTVAVAPPIPEQLLEKLAIEREGSFALPEGTDGLTLPAAVALGEDLAFVGYAWAHSESDPVGQSRRWIGVASEPGPARELELDMGSIHAAISDGQGGALLVGTDGPIARRTSTCCSPSGTGSTASRTAPAGRKEAPA